MEMLRITLIPAASPCIFLDYAELLLTLVATDEFQEFNRERQDRGRIALARDLDHRLKIAQLQGHRRGVHHGRRFS